MASMQSNNGGPRRSVRGSQPNPSAPPRHAFTPDDEPPILAGYTYQPGRAELPPPPPTASQPLLPSQPAPVSIDDYKPKRNTLWFVLLGVVLILAISAGIIINNLPQTQQPTPSPSTPYPTYATPTRTGGVAFADNNASGYWKITNTVWGVSGVQLTLEITVDSGTLYYDFYAYDDASNVLEPVFTSNNDLQPGFITASSTVRGTLSFEVSRQPLTLIMSSSQQQQLSALPVSG